MPQEPVGEENESAEEESESEGEESEEEESEGEDESEEVESDPEARDEEVFYQMYCSKYTADAAGKVPVAKYYPTVWKIAEL